MSATSVAMQQKDPRRTGDATRPEIMAALGVRAWLNLPRAANQEEMRESPLIDQRVMACIYEDTIGQFEPLSHIEIDPADGTWVAIAVHQVRLPDGSYERRETQQKHIAARLGIKPSHVSESVSRLVARGRIRLLGPSHRRIAFLPHPKPPAAPTKAAASGLDQTDKFLAISRR